MNAAGFHVGRMPKDYRAIVHDAMVVYLWALLATPFLLVMFWMISPIVFNIMEFHEVFDDGAGTFLALVYHSLQLSLLVGGLLYFKVHAARGTPTRGMKRLNISSNDEELIARRYYLIAAFAVIVISLVILELVFYFAFGISSIEAMVRQIEWFRQSFR